MNSRKRTNIVEGIVIHSMGEYVGEKYAPEFLESVGLSAHYLVTPKGDIIYGVPHKRIAYHAGLSKYKQWSDLNKNFLGIEMMIEGRHDWGSFREAIKKEDSFTKEMYESTAKLCSNLMDIYPEITKDNIVEHSKVSGPDVRPDPKIDPGSGFDIVKLKDMI